MASGLNPRNRESEAARHPDWAGGLFALTAPGRTPVWDRLRVLRGVEDGFDWQ